MDSFKLINALNLVKEYQILQKSGYNKRGSEHFLSSLFAYSEQALPNLSIYKYFLNKKIIDILFIHLCYYTIPQDEVKKRHIKIERDQSKSRYYYRIRQLGLNGSYPDIEVCKRGISFYNFLNVPFLITKNCKNTEEAGCQGEFSPFTRQEVKIAVAFICAHEFPISSFYFDDFSEEQFGEDLLSHVGTRDMKEFITTLYLIIAKDRDSSSLNPKPAYRFVSYGEYARELNLFIRKFSIQDNLLLRTANHLVKAGMLRKNYTFFEETLSNSYFALEGCMLILQRYMGIGTDRLHRRELREFFVEVFKRGEEIFDYLSEVIDWGGKRAELVHPAVASEESWMPCIFGDDHEYHDLTIQLMYYIVTGEVIKSRSKYGEYIELL